MWQIVPIPTTACGLVGCDQRIRFNKLNMTVDEKNVCTLGMPASEGAVSFGPRMTRKPQAERTTKCDHISGRFDVRLPARRLEGNNTPDTKHSVRTTGARAQYVVTIWNSLPNWVLHVCHNAF